jgi:hypothetical protein
MITKPGMNGDQTALLTSMMNTNIQPFPTAVPIPIHNPGMNFGGQIERSPTVTAIKPTLMPPTMFLPSKEDAGPAPSTSQTTIKPEPLTRNQLLQALNYLLQTDEEFMKKLHETYLKIILNNL